MATHSKTNALRRIRIQAFRGFRDSQELELDASALIVAGPNGTGKTSLFDAIQWCLTGSLSRVADLRAKRTIEHIVNQYRLNDRAEVDLTLGVGGAEVTLTRVGDHRGSSLELHDPTTGSKYGDEAEDALRSLLSVGEDLGIELALSTTGLMQQDVMRAMLQAKPAERYRHISTVLGLGALEDFEEEVRTAAAEAGKQADAAEAERAAAQNKLQDIQEQFVSAQTRLAQRPSSEAVRTIFERSWPSSPTTVATLSMPVHDLAAYRLVAEMAAEAGNAVAQVRRRAEAFISNVEGLAEPVDEPAIVAAQQRVAEVRAEAEDRKATREVSLRELGLSEQVATDMARLAAAAIPLLTQVCPVCGQRIDEQSIATELEQRSGQTAGILALRAALDDSDRDLASASDSLVQAEAALQGLMASARQWRERVAAEAQLRSAVADLRECEPQITLSEQSGSWPAEAIEVEAFLNTLQQVNLAAADALESLSQTVELARFESEIGSFTAAAKARAARADETRRRASMLKALLDSTLKARVEVTEGRFRSVQPLVADIFGRLDPHPTFKSIDFELDTYYRKGTTSPLVRDLVAGISADPLVIFSTSQANIAALSYFLAMGWSARERALPFVLLDDPIQSMDDVNVLGFADLSRHLRASRQLVVSTHERRFASLLERKLAPRQPNESTLVLEFEGWDRSGPAIGTRLVASQLDDRPIRIVRDAS